MFGYDDKEIPAVERGDRGDVQTLCDGDERSVNQAQSEIGVGLDKLCSSEKIR
jgi:hypothetical protein